MVARWVVLATAALAMACSGSPASGGSGSGGAFEAQPYTTATSTSGALVVEVRTAPSQPPPRGTCQVELRVVDRDGHGVDGLSVKLVPWMPAMGHGASVMPSVEATGDGRYRVDDVSLFMPGAWQLRVSIAGPVTDDATPIVQVP
jgi:hypothetical protein